MSSSNYFDLVIIVYTELYSFKLLMIILQETILLKIIYSYKTSRIPTEYEWFFKISTSLINRTLKANTSTDQCGPVSSGNKRLVHSAQVSRTVVSPSNENLSNTQDTFFL